MLVNVNVIYYVHICEMRGIALYKIYVLLLLVVIPPRLSDPGSFIPVPLVTSATGADDAFVWKRCV